jgi:glutamate N-acetyltransferase/amino-acid N-acetyltransferase
VAHTGHAGLREHGDDVAIVVSTTACASAAMFTRSLFEGPSVTISRPRAAAGKARGIVVVAKNANVATGDRGLSDAREVALLAAQAGGVDAEEMLIASTGVIGRPYPMPALRAHFERLIVAGRGLDPAQGPLDRAGPVDDAGGPVDGPGGPVDGPGGRPAGFTAHAGHLAEAMMTTDTVAKVAERALLTTSGAASRQARVVGVAKGVGMIEPDMATMLAFVFTDAAADPVWLAAEWRRAVDATFNCLSVDTDTSTSDTAVVLANGAAGPVDRAAMAVALREVCLDLTLQLARDGEGATKLLSVTVRRARDAAQARRVAKAVVNSPLVKTAVHGADPNWGRVAMAIGKCSADRDIDPARVVIRFGDLETYPRRTDDAGLGRLRRVMSADHVDIDIELATGDSEATVYGCDLSEGYVRINADYTT